MLKLIKKYLLKS